MKIASQDVCGEVGRSAKVSKRPLESIVGQSLTELVGTAPVKFVFTKVATPDCASQTKTQEVVPLVSVLPTNVTCRPSEVMSTLLK